jgi:hypothetical protein
VEDSDGKSDAGVREISLDPFTVRLLRDYVVTLDKERKALGKSYPDHGKLMCYEDGRRLHPGTVTRRFNRLVDRAGVRRIRLHDIRHTYSTMSLDAGIDPKIVSDRVGHANMNVTFQVHAHRFTGRDRAAAQTIADLIRAALPSTTPTTNRSTVRPVGPASPHPQGDSLGVVLPGSGGSVVFQDIGMGCLKTSE